MPLDPIVVARIVALIEDGREKRETARIVGKSLCAVQNVYQRYQETGLITRRPGSGRKRVTTQRDDRFLVSRSLRNRTASAVFLRNQLQEVRNVIVSERTVRRRLHSNSLSCRRMATGPPLHRRHRIGRLAFARNHLAWNDDDWSKVLFQMSHVFALMAQTDVDEYGEDPEKDMLQFVLTNVFHLAVVRLWFGQELLHKPLQSWSSYRMAL